MGEVICTLIYRENNHLDLVLPDHIPVNQLVESITTALRIPKEPQTYYDLLTNEEDRLVKLPQCSSLRQSYILNGSILHLVKVKYEKPLNGYLVYQNCTRFHLLENSIIGRSTRELIVDIDLGELDVFQVVSRRHAVIT